MNAETQSEEKGALVALQSRIAELEREIETLNAVVVEQADALSTLRRRFDALLERFLAVEAHAGPDVPVDRPPHW